MPVRSRPDLRGRRVLITGAARGIGAALARALHAEGAHVALVGIEPDLLREVAASCGDAPWVAADVTDLDAVAAAVEECVDALGGLDVAVANAGVASQLPLVGGDPDLFDAHVDVNLRGVYHTIRATGPHLSHDDGYLLVVSSMAAAVHLPLMGAYCATKAGVEALGNSARIELRPTGARVGVAYFAEIDTDMTSRGFGTRAARRLTGGTGVASSVTPLPVAVDALLSGIARRRRTIVTPRYARPVLALRGTAQRVAETALAGRVSDALEVARSETVSLTTPQPHRPRR